MDNYSNFKQLPILNIFPLKFSIYYFAPSTYYNSQKIIMEQRKRSF